MGESLNLSISEGKYDVIEGRLLINKGALCELQNGLGYNCVINGLGCSTSYLSYCVSLSSPEKIYVVCIFIIRSWLIRL